VVNAGAGASILDQDNWVCYFCLYGIKFLLSLASSFWRNWTYICGFGVILTMWRNVSVIALLANMTLYLLAIKGRRAARLFLLLILVA